MSARADDLMWHIHFMLNNFYTSTYDLKVFKAVFF